jgi:aldehyde:ferredoxin oxidoreductase
MNDLTVRFEGVPKAYERLGGRALTSRLVSDEVPPDCNPLGPKNRLVLAPGLLGGLTASSVGRLSVGGKSPLTGGIKEANAGGTPATKLARLGIKAIIVEGIPAGDVMDTGPFTLVIRTSGAELVRCAELGGLGVYESASRLAVAYGGKAGLVLIGPAGEMKLAAAGIACTDLDGAPTRYAGRGGLGAVMGSKGLKAIVVDDTGTSGVDIADPELYRAILKDYTRTVASAPGTLIYKEYGTAAMSDNTNALGGLPTRNFSTGTFELAEQVSGRRLRDVIIERNGKPSHRCMAGCAIECSNVFPCKDGSVVSPLEYETIGLLGPNCGIGDLDAIATLNCLCNDYGLDTIDTGGALGVAMEAGLIKFGDSKAAIELLREVPKGTVLGRLIGSGGAVVGKVLGVLHVPAVKGQVMAAYEPRAIKGLGVTYATSPMGADHTAGNTIRQPIDHRSPEGQVEASRKAQIGAAVYDSLGACLFVGVGLAGRLDYLVGLVNARYAWDWTPDDVMELGKTALRTEVEFNRKAGLAPASDDLPDFFREEANPAVGTTFDVPKEELRRVLSDM